MKWIEVKQLSEIPFQDLKEYPSILFLDLDGTSRGGNPDNEQLFFSYLRSLEERKLLLTVFSSGRAVEGLKDLGKDLRLGRKMMMGNNGTRLLYRSSADTLYYWNYQDPILKEAYPFIKSLDESVNLIGTFGQEGTQLMFPLKDITTTIREKVEAQFPSLCFTDCGSNTTHLHSRATGKGALIAKVLSLSSYDKNKTIAAGDSYNDLDVVDNVGVFVTLEGAIPQLKKIAHFVIDGEPGLGLIPGIDAALTRMNVTTNNQLDEIKAEITCRLGHHEHAANS